MKHLLLMACLCGALQASAQPWELKKEEDGIRIYTRTADNSRFNEVKVETIVSGKLSSLAALILDIGSYPNWSFNTEKTSVLKRVGPAELYYYSLIHSPWPASDRDLAVHLHISQDSSTRTMYIHATGIPGYIPEKKGIVRVPVSIERWVVTPLPGDRIRINYELQVDPGASAPAWLINLLSTKGPFETFCHIRDQLKQPKYHDATLAFIRN
jgi:START domain